MNFNRPFSPLIQAPQIGRSVEWLRARLRAIGHAPTRQHPLGRALDRLEQVVAGQYRKNEKRAPLRRFLVEAMSADVLSHVLRHARDLPVGFDNHWTLLTKGDVLPTHEGGNTTARNMVWELFIGALVTQFATDVQASDPDVTCRFMGRTFGLACKCLYTNEPVAQVERIVEGAKQLEGANVDDGMIVVNVVNLLPHDAFFYNYARWGYADDPVGFLDRYVQDEIIKKLPLKRLDCRLSDGVAGPRTKTRGLLFFASALLATPSAGPALAMPIVPYYFRRVGDETERRFLLSLGNALNRSLAEPPPGVIVIPRNGPIRLRQADD